MHNILVCACKSQDFAQSQKKIAQSHDREIVTFRNSGSRHLIDHVNSVYGFFVEKTNGILIIFHVCVLRIFFTTLYDDLGKVSITAKLIM